jgi:hypothetical protein
MKITLLVLSLLPIFALAQNCKLRKETDQFTQQPKITTGFIPLGYERLTIDATSKEIDFFFSLNSVKDSKCFDDESTVTIVYEGDRLKYNARNSGTMNCDGYFHFTLRNGATTATSLQNLSTKKVKTIRFTNKKIITDIQPTEEQKTVLMDMAACIAKEAKTLIKTP